MISRPAWLEALVDEEKREAEKRRAAEADAEDDKVWREYLAAKKLQHKF